MAEGVRQEVYTMQAAEDVSIERKLVSEVKEAHGG